MLPSINEIITKYGIDPASVSKNYTRHAIIEYGVRKGLLCVYAADKVADPSAIAKPNFVDIEVEFAPYEENPNWVYLFKPLN